ncbi:MAG: hypothetical protein ACE5FW_03040 [Candidatus Aenigmatarchaeota archaeon]
MRRKEFKARLKKCTDVTHSRHVIEDKYERGIVKRKNVENNLKNPERLIRFREEESIKSGTFKYKVWFALSRAKVLGVVVELNDKTHVITAWEIINKWQKKVWSIWKK